MSLDLFGAGLAIMQRGDSNDCCTFVARVLLRAFGRVSPGAAWDSLANVHPDLPGGRVSSIRAWGPVRAAAVLGVVESATFPPDAPRLELGRWHVCQRWAELDPDGGVTPAAGDRGHTWLYLAVDEERGVVLDSSAKRGPLIEGFRQWSELADPYRGKTAAVAVGVLVSL